MTVLRSGNRTAFPSRQPRPEGLPCHRGRWLQEQYSTTEALRKAWGRENVDLANPPLPSIAERFGGNKIFLDPGRDRAVTDYFRFGCESKCRTIVAFAEGIKKAMGRPVICGSYFEDGLYRCSLVRS